MKVKDVKWPLFICGVGIGWLAGLSVSPVLPIIMTSILSLVTAFVGVIAGMKSEESSAKLQISPTPIVMLVLGIALSAPFGIYARTNKIFGENPRSLVYQLIKAGVSEDSARIYVKDYTIQSFRNFSNVPYLAKNISDSQVNNFRNQSAGLYYETTSICDAIRMQHGIQLRAVLLAQNRDDIKKFISITSDSLALEGLKSILCN